MSWHLHGTILTDQGTAGNNRGDSEGTKSTLQKIFRNGESVTTVSAEAIRYALREGLHYHMDRDPDAEHVIELDAQIKELQDRLNGTDEKPAKKTRGKKKAEEQQSTVTPEELDKKRKEQEKKRQQWENEMKKKQQAFEELKSKKRDGASIKLNRTMSDHKSNSWHDREFRHWKEFVDDDVLGYMKAKEQTVSHRGILEITRAISTTPWRGEVMVNYASPGSNLGVTHDNPIPYAIEVHHTRYQYTFTLTPEALAKDQFERTQWVLEGLVNLRRVGGNHAHFLFDFAPSAVVFRWTQDPAPRIMYCFDEDDYGGLSLKRLTSRVTKKDIDVNELWIGSVVDLRDLPEQLKEDRSPNKHGPKSIVESMLKSIKSDLLTSKGDNPT